MKNDDVEMEKFITASKISANGEEKRIILFTKGDSFYVKKSSPPLESPPRTEINEAGNGPTPRFSNLGHPSSSSSSSSYKHTLVLFSTSIEGFDQKFNHL